MRVYKGSDGRWIFAGTLPIPEVVRQLDDLRQKLRTCVSSGDVDGAMQAADDLLMMGRDFMDVTE